MRKEYYSFSAALVLMKEGMRVSRTDKRYTFNDVEEIFIDNDIITGYTSFGCYIPVLLSNDDILADDWFVVGGKDE